MPVTSENLFDRYLHAVEFWLPSAQRQDIVAELAEDLRSQIADREEALGRALTEDELVEVLRKRGAPMRVAAGYLPQQRLINPAMLPAYRLVLKIALLWVLLPLFVIGFAGPLLTSAHPERVLLQFWVEAWRTGFTVVGVVTIVFALFDRYQVKFRALDHWNPRSLPKVPTHPETSSRWNHLAGFVFGMVGAVCWVYFLWQRTEFAFPGGPVIVLGAAWQYLYWPVLVLMLISASADLLAFLYPCWARTRAWVRLGADACLLVMVATAFRTLDSVTVIAPNLTERELAKVTEWVNLSVQVTLAIIAVSVVVDGFQVFRRYSDRSAITGSTRVARRAGM